MRLRVWLAVWLLLGTCLAGSRRSTSSVIDLLNRYASGEFRAVVDELDSRRDLDDVLRQLRRDGPRWIDGAGAEPRSRRQLAAATFALEAARSGEWRQWKLVQRQPPMIDYQPPSILHWQAPPLLIEWGCQMLRSLDPRHPMERWWQLAALAVAQRSEDPQFLIGDVNLGKGLGSEEIGNTADEIKHLDHVTPRFAHEARFLLAQGIARDTVWPTDATSVYLTLAADPDVGGEALMRLGAIQARQRRAADAIRTLERAERVTRDPYVVYLARYFKGITYEQQGDLRYAEAAYRGASAAVPRGQSATLPLASILVRTGHRDEAQRLVAEMLASPASTDPWREFVHADDRFWPHLIARLRAEIAP